MVRKPGQYGDTDSSGAEEDFSQYKTLGRSEEVAAPSEGEGATGEADSSDAEEDISQYKTSEKPPEPEAAKQSPKDSFSKQLESSKRKIPTILTL